MRLFVLPTISFAATIFATAVPRILENVEVPLDYKISPKIMIITHVCTFYRSICTERRINGIQYDDERNIFTGNSADNSSFGNLLAQTIRVKGLFSQFPDVHCTRNSDVCIYVTGEGMAHAAASTMAVAFDERFDLKKTYFLAIGVAGGNPKTSTMGDFTSLSPFSPTC